MVAIGYASGPEGNKIIYNDPAPPGIGDIWMVSYEDFAAKQGAHDARAGLLRCTLRSECKMSSERVPIALTIVAGFLAPFGMSWCIQRHACRIDRVDECAQGFQGIAEPRSARLMGFDSLQDLDRAKLGAPISVEAVNLTKLGKDEVDPFGSLVDTHSNIYPVLIDGEPRSSIILQQADHAWRPQAYGGANLIRNISKVQSKNPGTQYKVGCGAFVRSGIPRF